MSKNLSGKNALVTGGARGIGAAIARKLATQGANVAISYAASADAANLLAKELETLGVRALAFQADQADATQVAGLVKTVIKEFGSIDILINNAGVFTGGTPGTPELDVAALDRQWAINVGGVRAAVYAAASQMKEGGRIITIGSCMAEGFPFQGAADYSATKAAVAGLTRGWARDFGPKGVTVNTVQPGPIATDLNPEQGDFADMLRSTIALGRYGKTDEVAALVGFLASPEASYITGAAINVDGGFNA